MKAKIVLVEPEYAENIGLIARAMKNFGCRELLIVKPKASLSEAKAKSRAMHAQDVLQKARVFESIEKALGQVDYAVATTAKPASSKKLFRTAVSPKKLAQKFSGANAAIGIVFGRESSGLSNPEIRQCDFVASIPSSRKYPTLNISHAVAIILYELFAAEKKIWLKTAGRKTKKLLLKKLEKLIDESKTIQDKNSVFGSFKALFGRALVTEKEAMAMLALLSEFEKQSLKKIRKD